MGIVEVPDRIVFSSRSVLTQNGNGISKGRGAYAETAPKYQGPATLMFHSVGVFHVNQPERSPIPDPEENEIVAKPNQ